MNSKSKFILSIVVLTVLLIGFLTGVFIMSMFMATKGVTTERIGILVINIGLGLIVMTKMIRLNNRETASRIDSVVKDHHEFVALWSIPSDLWHRYLRAKLVFDISESNSYGFISAGIATLIFVITSAASFPLLRLITIGAGMFFFVFIAVKLGSIVIARKRYSRHAQSSEAEIYFAQDLIIINGQLTMLNEFGYRLKAFDLVERFDCHVLSFIVETGLGHRKNQRNYFIPIPDSNKEEAEKLIAYYAGLIQ